jgi:hypothetical protein
VSGVIARKQAEGWHPERLEIFGQVKNQDVEIRKEPSPDPLSEHTSLEEEDELLPPPAPKPKQKKKPKKNTKQQQKQQQQQTPKRKAKPKTPPRTAKTTPNTNTVSQPAMSGLEQQHEVILQSLMEFNKTLNSFSPFLTPQPHPFMTPATGILDKQ